jgi:hypothetical protein
MLNVASITGSVGLEFQPKILSHNHSFLAQKKYQEISTSHYSIYSPQNYSLAIIVVEIFTVFFAWVVPSAEGML